MTIKLTRTRVAALVALAVVGVAGAGYAAIPSANGTISACVDAKGALKVIDTEAGVTCGGGKQLLQWNQQGPAGPQGPVGAALGYARVLPREPGSPPTPVRVDPARTLNVTSANLAQPASGKYCFGGLPFTPKSITATPGLSVGVDEPTTPVLVRGDVSDAGLNGCPAGFQQAVVVVVNSSLTPRDADVYVVFN